MILANLISQAHKTECTLNVFCGILCQYKRCDFFSIVNFRRIWVRFTLLGRHQFGSQRVHPTIDVRRCRPKVKLRISSPTRMVRKYKNLWPFHINLMLCPSKWECFIKWELPFLLPSSLKLWRKERAKEGGYHFDETLSIMTGH